MAQHSSSGVLGYRTEGGESLAYIVVPPTPQQIRTEIMTDPGALGYAAPLAVKDWNALLAALNLVRAGAPFVINRRSLTAQEIVESIVHSEWIAAAVTAPMREGIQLILTTASTEGLDPQNPNVRAFFTGAFAAGTVTRTNLTAKLTRQGSRAEVLWGDGVIIGRGAVALADRG